MTISKSQTNVKCKHINILSICGMWKKYTSIMLYH